MKKLCQLKDRLSKYGLCENDQSQIKGGNSGGISLIDASALTGFNTDNTNRPKSGGGFPPILEGNSIAANFGG